MKAVKLKIGEVANLLTTSIRTIRYYEEESLLKPIRTDKGTRLYSEKHLERLKIIQHLAQNGFSIESIRTICSTRETCKTGDESSKKIKDLISKTQARLVKEINALNEIHKELDIAEKVVLGCSGCNNSPNSIDCPDCPVKKHIFKNGILNLVWDQK